MTLADVLMEDPRAFALFSALALVVLASLVASRRDHPLARLLRLALRGAVMTSVVLAIARPATFEDTETLDVVLAVDVSDSMSDEALDEARSFARQTLAARGETSVRVIRFAGRAEEVALPETPDEPVSISRFEDPAVSRASAIARAVELAAALGQEGASRRVVLFTDGLDTSGATPAAPSGLRVFYRTPSAPSPAEVAVTAVEVPSTLETGRTFEVRVALASTHATSGRLTLRRDGAPNAPDFERDLTLVPGRNEVVFRSVVHVPGPVTYLAELTPHGADRFPENNRFALGAFVPGRPTVLFVDPDPSRATQLPRALVAADFDVEVRRPREFPTSVRELERFVFLVLSNVAAADLPGSAQEIIERYVRDTGGGALFSGGNQAFELGGWQGTRLERIFPVRLDTERRRDEPSLALALVIDRSGSMQGRKIQLAKEAAKATASALGREDYLGVIGFDTAPRRIVRMQSAANRTTILADIDRLTASGGTSITPALDAAFQDLSAVRARYKHVILLTDGIAREDRIDDLVATMRADGITVTTVGLGADVQRSLLESIAERGGGRAHFTNDPESVPRIFLRETTLVQQSSGVDEYVRAVMVRATDSLRGFDIGSAPGLHGYIATRARGGAAQALLDTDTGDPLLARLRVGLGWSLAWTSDLHSRWSAEWLRWPGFQPFWSGLVREHMRNLHRETLPMTARLDGENIHVVVDAIDGDDAFANGLTSTLRLRGPLGASSPDDAEVELIQTAPGRYEARLPVTRYGAFELTARHRMGGVPFAESATSLGVPYPQEIARSTPDTLALSRLATESGGRSVEHVATIFAPLGDTTRALHPQWRWLVFLAIGLYLAELTLRRLLPTVRRRSDRP